MQKYTKSYINGVFTFEIKYSSNGPIISRDDKGYAVITKVSNHSCVDNGILVIPSTLNCNGVSYTVRAIAGNVFLGFKDITCVNLGEIIHIEDNTFAGCDSITSVIVNSKKNLFAVCILCESIKVKIIRLDDSCEGLKTIGGVLFSGDGKELIKCPSGRVGDYMMPDGVTTISRKAFAGCTALTSVTIPDGVTSIRGSSFSGCSSLTSVIIPSSVTSIGDFAFSGCNSLNNIEFPKSIVEFGSGIFEGCKKINLNSAPKHISYIPQKMFAGCSSITEIELPSYVNIIECSAFEDCANLVRVNMNIRMTIIGEKAFSGCVNLREVIMPDDLQELGSSVFEGCEKLSSISLPDTLTIIKNNSFHGCTSLRKVKLPNQLKEIGSFAFSSCKSLVKIDFPESLEKIAYRAFYEADSLTSLIFYQNIKTIGIGFRSCKNIKNVKIYSNNPPAVPDERVPLFLTESTYSEPVFDRKTIVHVIRGANYEINPNWRACNLIQDIEPLKANRIELVTQSRRINLDDEIKPEAIIYPLGVFCKEVKWSSSDESKLSHLGNGLFYAVGKGSADIIVETIDGSNLKSTCEVIIN